MIARDLHPLLSEFSTIEFRVVRGGRQVRVDVPSYAIGQRFGAIEGRYSLLRAYEAHRREIDAAVLRRAEDGGAGVVVVRPVDLWG